MRFIHAADIHLGYQQYNLHERYRDFSEAYLGMVEHAVAGRVDFVLIAGDLFHQANTDARTLSVAISGLERLRRADIPVVAIEGNHDAQHQSKRLSWMEFLNQQGLLTLLDAQRDGGAMSLPCYDPVERAGAYVDLAGARIYGLKYYGAATARVLEQTQELIAPSPFSILMLHTGLLGQVPHMHGGLSAGQLDALRPRVDYLALGHIHKHLIRDRWVCNPGSPETVSFEEAEWFHGFLDVTVEDGNAAITPVTTKSRRPFVRIHVLADGCRSLDDFMERVEEKAAAAGIPAGSVVEVSLQGVAEFRRQDVPLEALQMAVQARFDPLTVRVRNGLTPAGTLRTRASERESRSELDRRVVEHLIDAAGQSYQAADWVDLILDIKGMAAEHQDAASIAAHLEDALSHRSQSRPVVASVEPAPSRASKETFDPAQLDW